MPPGRVFLLRIPYKYFSQTYCAGYRERIHYVIDSENVKENAMTEAQKTPIAAKHAYRPIPSFGGKVLKYAGFQNTQETFDFYTAYWSAEQKEGDHLYGEYLPGVVWLDDYIGDRITADTHAPYTGL